MLNISQEQINIDIEALEKNKIENFQCCWFTEVLEVYKKDIENLLEFLNKDPHYKAILDLLHKKLLIL